MKVCFFFFFEYLILPIFPNFLQLNIAVPQTSAQKLIEIDDDHKLRMFYDKRMGQEVEADPLGEEWKGYVFRITGGNDKQGFPMKQGVLTNGRVRLLLSAGHSCYRPRRSGERKRKSVRGCIVDSNLSVLALTIVKRGMLYLLLNYFVINLKFIRSQ